MHKSTDHRVVNEKSEHFFFYKKIIRSIKEIGTKINQRVK